MTSNKVMQDLREVDRLIAALSMPGGIDIEDLDDLCWLLTRRQSLADLLSVRCAQRGKKVVNLALWRYGSAAG